MLFVCLCHSYLPISNLTKEYPVTEKGGSRKPAAMTQPPTDPGSHNLSIHLKSTDA